MPIFSLQSDWTFLKFLMILQIQGTDSLDYMKKEEFHSFAAREIVNFLITGNEIERLTELMNKLKEVDSLLLEEIDSFKEEEWQHSKGTVTRKIFDQVGILTPDSLNLLALIRIQSDHFQGSYKLLAEMWDELEKLKDENEETFAKIKNNALSSISTSLDELEKLVISKNEKQSEAKKISEQNIEDYRKTNCKLIEKKLKKEKITESELDVEIQNKLAKLRTETLNQTEIDEIKKNVSDNIKLKKAEKELNDLLESCQKKLSLKEKKTLLRKINFFAKKNNPFYQQVYQKRKEEIEKLIKKLESDNHTQQISSPNDSFSLAAKSMIGGYLLLTIVIVLKKMPKLRN
ncbi:MAG: hypothetical protein GBAus27B_000499 [Mycoplasmataceae bacterium]|nr:MAG: hypothetical protein GBAus27B_000499 [Mycoplasmataceae bacterium]